MIFHRIQLWTIILLTCAFNKSYALTLELYENPEYSGLIKTEIVEPKDERECIKLDKFYTVRSVKTDRCVMLYESEDCRHWPGPANLSGPHLMNLPYYSVRVGQNAEGFIFSSSYGLRENERGVNSFHVCSKKLDVDLYSSAFYQGPAIKNWRGLCKCENVPASTFPASKNFSIDNHGSSVFVHSEENCRGWSAYIPAGDNDHSRLLYDVFKYEVKSFRPASYMDCESIKLDAVIYKWTFVNGSELGGIIEEHVPLATTHILENNKSSPITQNIEYSATFANSLKYSVPTALTNTNSSRVKADAKMDYEFAIPFLLQPAFQLSLATNYKHMGGHQETVTKNFVFTGTERVKVTTPVVVAPYENCKVNAFVKVVKNFPVTYTAEALVQGTDIEKQPAEEIRAEILAQSLPPGMQYIYNPDEYTAKAIVVDTMRAEFPLKAFVRKVCQKMDDSEYHGEISDEKPYEEIYEFPLVLVGKEHPREPQGAN